MCKVRGLNVVVGLLSNEPKYIEPMLKCFDSWKSAQNASKIDMMIWEERYIMLVWLSHLMLTPFDLASVSSLLLPNEEKLPSHLPRDLPNVAASMLSLAWSSLNEPSKEREAASVLIVRLVLRPDMQRQGLLRRLVDHAIDELSRANQSSTNSVYRTLGLLSLLAGVMTRGSDEDVAPITKMVFSFCSGASTDESTANRQIRDSAPARKLLIKTMRASLLCALSLSEKHHTSFNFNVIDPMIEDTIQSLLESVADKDTPVRLAASKALSVVTLKLESAMAAEVVQAVIDSLSENMLYHQPGSSELVTITDIDLKKQQQYRPNFGAVDPLRWHGLMLSLSHLLFRRSPPPQQLASIIQCLLLGLNFEQRSNVGTSVGVSVRDAACFGIWAMCRKYTTVEINAVKVSEVHQTSVDKAPFKGTENVVQLLAAQLVVSSCLDPSGNIRRGSSAALQELVGRHPDTAEEGIALVQIVDYHSVARRSRAVNQVSTRAAALSSIYYTALLMALFDWRGSRATDADSRRSAADAIGQIALLHTQSNVRLTQATIIDEVKRLKHANTGNNAEARHGLLLALAASMNASAEQHTNSDPSVFATPTNSEEGRRDALFSLSLWDEYDEFVGDLHGRVTRELELAFEAACVLLSAIARSLLAGNNSEALMQDSHSMVKIARVVDILERCQLGSEKDVIVNAAANAASDVFKIFSRDQKVFVLERWLHDNNVEGPEGKSKGRIMALGAVYPMMPEDGDHAEGPRHQFQTKILERLKHFAIGAWPIETKISAMISLRSIVPYLELSKVGLEHVFLAALTDYTIDQRGDVGSHLRVEGIKIMQAILSLDTGSLAIREALIRPMQEVAKLAGEKLDKVRFEAWSCLQSYWQKQTSFPAITQSISHLADISSTAYFRQLLDLLEVDQMRKHVVQGMVSSAVAGSEDLGRRSRAAIIMYIQDPCHSYVEAQELFARILLEYLKVSSADDRIAIPTMELLAFIVEQSAAKAALMTGYQQQVDLMEVMQTVHLPSSSLPRVEASLKVYSSLLAVERTRKAALERLTRMLLHRYPKIRNAVADTLLLHTDAEEIISNDWSRPAGELKLAVKNLRKTLRVV